jgi:hypothetical protein
MLKQIFKKIKESRCNLSNLKNVPSMELQALKRIILDRVRTNYDDKWNREYFYVNKNKAKKDNEFMVKILSKYDLICSEDELARYFLDGEDPKDYFSK